MRNLKKAQSQIQALLYIQIPLNLQPFILKIKKCISCMKPPTLELKTARGGIMMAHCTMTAEKLNMAGTFPVYVEAAKSSSNAALIKAINYVQTTRFMF